MEKELRIESFYNAPYKKLHKKRIRLLNSKQKLVLAYTTVGAIIFSLGMAINEIVNIFN